ncbi:MAG: PIN domain-containing protein [Candidatus Kariarchaeaceae archaeon]
MKSLIWDTGALALFFVNNEVLLKFMDDIVSGTSKGYVPQLVFSEFYYKTWQKFGEQAAILRTKTLRESSLEEYILDEKDTYVVGKFKLDYSFLSIIDAIVVASAKATNSVIITSDTDFLKVKGIKVKKINY